MDGFAKTQNQKTTRVVQEEIGRGLRAEYEMASVGDPIPNYFTALLAQLELKERIARVGAKVDRLRQGVKGPRER